MAKESKRIRNARAREALQALRDADLTEIDSRRFEELYIQTRDRFDELGIPEESGLRDELLEAIDRAILHYDPPQNPQSQEPEQTAEIRQFIPDFAKGPRQFVGMAGKQKLHVTAAYDQLTISRLYGGGNQGSEGRITLFWRFNSAGRIEQVAGKVFEKDEEETLIEVPQATSRDSDWNESLALTGEFPREIQSADVGLYFHKEPWKRQQTLLRYGHGTAKNVVLELQNGGVRGSSGALAKNQRTLQMLVNDETALHMLENCASIIPEVWTDKGQTRIVYQRNREYEKTKQP